jgi:Na+-driven multidrug efflux pump
MAIGAAVSAMAAQNIGAGRWDRIGRITGAGFAFNILITGAMAAAIMLFDRPLLGLFDLGADSPATPIAEHIILLASWGFVLFGITMVVLSTVRANGAVIGPLLIFATALIPVRIGSAIAAQPYLGSDALWWSFPAGSIVAVVLSLLYFYYGPWRKGTLLDEIDGNYAREETLASGEQSGRLNPSG